LHSHSHRGNTGGVLKWSFFATTLFVVLEFAAGIQAHSLALVSDAGHNLTDALALLLAWLAHYLQSKPPDSAKTFGYHRAGVLAAFVNALVLVGLSVWIFWESYHRLLRPRAVDETLMLAVAAGGLLLNGAIMWGLRPASRRDLNVRSAYAHMLGDALGSIAIICGAIGIRYTGWTRIDPLLSIVIGSLIIWTAWDIIKESLNILLEGLPRGMRLEEIVSAMQGVEGILAIHDLHIWSLGSSVHALSCHALIADVPLSASEAILTRLNGMLAERYQISHTTIQFEHANCAVSEACSIVSPAQRLQAP